MHTTSQARVFYFRTALQQRRAEVKAPGLRGWHAYSLKCQSMHTTLLIKKIENFNLSTD
jgi:hypothetical protein